MSKPMKLREVVGTSESAPVGNKEFYRPTFKDKIGWLGFLAAMLPLLAIISPINHDETQYIAAAQLVSEGLVPFRDFLYLQTPYQIYLFAPLFGIFGESGFVAARAATGMLGAGILAITFVAQRAMKVEEAQAAICCILLWLCHTFVFSVTVVRNDALPALLLVMAIWIAARQLSEKSEGEKRAGSWLIAGALLGLAAGTKISYLAPAFAFAAFPAWAFLLKTIPLRVALSRSASIGFGMVLALLPLLWFRNIAPLAFDYGNFEYHAEAPLAWYAANGLEERLTLLAKTRDALLTLVRGPALFALAIYSWLRLRSFRNRDVQSQFVILIDMLILAGLAATVAPTPTWRQYAMPLLPPLFIGLGLVWRDVGNRQSSALPAAKLAMLIAATIGIGQPIFQLWQGTLGSEASPLTISKEGAYLAKAARNAGLDGESVSLSPEVVLASGLPLDPTFATGPFAYRTGSMIAPADRRLLNVTTVESIEVYLEQTRPDIIVTGYEKFDHVDTLGLEAPIEAYAQRHHYRRVESPFGQAVFWLRTDQQ